MFKKIIAGAAGTEVKLSAGNYTGQIEFSDTGKITAADGFILTGGFNTAGGLAAGMIDFAGSATISGDLGGAGSALGAVKVAGASTLQIGGNVNVASLDGTNDGSDQNLKFTNAADIEVKGDIGAGANLKFNQIEFAGAHIVDFKNRLVANTLHFNASANVITTAFDLGGTNITAGITNAKLTVNKDQTITGAIRDFGTLHVNGDKTINLNTPDFEATITTENDDEGTINFNVNGPKVKSIGTAGEKFKIVNIRAKVIAGTHGVDGVFTETLNINANAEAILADVNADNITVNDNGKVGFFGSLTSANPIIFTNADSTAGFFDIDIDNALISHGGAGNGKIGIYGSNVNVDIGTDAASVKEVEFNDRTANVPGLVTRAISEIDANIYAQDIFVENGYELQLKKDVEFKGKTNIDEATITLGENDLKLINGDSSITTSTINTTVDRGNVGNFVAGNGANVTLNGDITIDITVTNLPANNARVVLVKKEGKEGNGRLIKGVNLKPIINTKGAFVGWKEDYTDNEFALIFQDKTAEVISSDLASIGASSDTTAENSQAIEDAIDGTEGEQIQSLFNSISDTSERADAIVRLVDNLSDNASAVSVVNVDLAIESISSRLSDNFVIPLDSSVFNFTPDTPDIGSSTPSSSLPPQIVDSVGNAAPANAAPANATPANATSTGSTTQAGGANASKPAATTPQKANTNTTGPNDGKARTQRKVSSEEIIYGLSAGDDAARYGVWMAPFAGNGVKKKNKSTSGYKSTSVGGTFGFDTKVNDNMVLGLAVTALNSRVNHKDFKKGDKTKIDTTLFSAYASIDMGNNWFSQNIASIGSSRVENKENRRVSRAAGYQIAKGKYSTMHFALESTAGFNKLINNQVVLTPSVGVGYSRINDTSYTETGNVGPQALTITKKAAQKLELIGGLRLTGLPFMVNEMYVTPEVHASVRHDVIGKNPTTFSKVNGLRDLKEKSKPTKTHYGVGGGLKFSYNMMDYGVYADTTYAKKYVGVNGSVNVRVNF
ncbi:MAG: autotransporter outer membrane beta-barrel domain-containing protein [Rickettsiales bacterium]|nr:MAG: autotransporter outer membrane beta-barrel domain-containing protein [Rickettsiales bacterium]